MGLSELCIFRSSIKLLERSSGVSLKPSTLLFRRRSLSDSPIGGIPETQEMLDFCGEHNITADVE